MKYAFIENSRGAMFANNNALHQAGLYAQQKRTVKTLDDL
jgi:hypothetical protein